MTDLPNDPLDDAFAQQLRMLNPATASARIVVTRNALFRNSPLSSWISGGSRGIRWCRPTTDAFWRAQIGFPSTRTLDADDRRQCDDCCADTSDRLQAGRHIPNTALDTIAGHVDPKADSTQRPNADDPDANSSHQPAADDPEVLPESPVRSVPILNLAGILQPEWTLPESRSKTLTAFNAPPLDSIPRSSWIATEDESIFSQETMSAGDLDKLTIGLQVNQR